MLVIVPTTNTGPFARLRRLSGKRRRLLARATGLLAVASVGVALLPFRRAIRFGSVPLGRNRGLGLDDAVWAIEAAARRLPLRTACIEKGLAVQHMLRSAGVDALLHYGARHSDTGKLEAHVWVTVHGHAVIGGSEAAQFPLIATYPGAYE
jgi:hypothetical protein